MHPIWSSHIRDPEEKEKFEEAIRNSSLLLDRLVEIIEQKIEAKEKQQKDLEAYKMASWPCFQADCIGSIRTLKEILQLTNRKDKVNNA